MFLIFWTPPPAARCAWVRKSFRKCECPLVAQSRHFQETPSEHFYAYTAWCVPNKKENLATGEALQDVIVSDVSGE